MDALPAISHRQSLKRTRADSDLARGPANVQPERKRAFRISQARPSSQLPPALGPDARSSISPASSATLVDDSGRQSWHFPPSHSNLPYGESGMTASSNIIIYPQPGMTTQITTYGGQIKIETLPLGSATPNGHATPAIVNNDTSRIHHSVRSEITAYGIDSLSSSFQSDNSSDSEEDTSENSSGDRSSDADSDPQSTLTDNDISDVESDSESDKSSSRNVTVPIRASTPISQPPIPAEMPARQRRQRPWISEGNFVQLKSRLESLLPQMEAANAELEAEARDGTLEERNIERFDEGAKAHIELDLALGVLEERERKKTARDGVMGVLKNARGAAVDADKSVDEPVLPTLVPGGERKERKVRIEEVEEKS